MFEMRLHFDCVKFLVVSQQFQIARVLLEIRLNTNMAFFVHLIIGYQEPYFQYLMGKNVRFP